MNPLHYGLKGHDYPLHSEQEYFEQLTKTIKGEMTPLTLSSIWNAGFYLWRCSVVETMEMGLSKAEELIMKGDLHNHCHSLSENLNYV